MYFTKEKLKRDKLKVDVTEDNNSSATLSKTEGINVTVYTDNQTYPKLIALLSTYIQSNGKLFVKVGINKELKGKVDIDWVDN